LFPVAGGFVAALVARRAPLAHAAVLAAVALAGTVASVVLTPLVMPQDGGLEPPWYPYVLGVLGPGGILLGGWLRTLGRPARAEPAPY
jgi:protein-S-isoprenylcysteine O-methyltransferase Ste14